MESDSAGKDSKRNPMERKKRSAPKEVDKRVNEIFNSLLSAMPIGKIIHTYSNRYEVSPAQIRQYIKKAKEIVKEDSLATRDEQIQQGVSRRLSYIHKVNLQLSKKFDNATLRQLRMLEVELARFLGLYAAEGQSTAAPAVDAETHLKLINELIRRGGFQANDIRDKGTPKNPADMVTESGPTT